MKFLLVSLCAALALVAAPALAQYVYVDVNGDGVCTTSDVVSSSTTSIDIYFRTDQNADGTPVECVQDPLQLMDFFGYEFILRYSGAPYGSVTYGVYINHISQFTIPLVGSGAVGTDYHTGWGAATPLGPGLYLVGTLVIAVTPGTNPVIGFAASSSNFPSGLTAFYSSCLGADFDNTIKLGSDFLDACSTVGSEPQPPVVTAPATVSGAEGSLLTFAATATDPNGDPIDSLTAAPLPPGATFTPNGTNTSGTFSWTPGFDQAGVFNVTISAKSACRSSGVSYPTIICDVGTAAVQLTVANTDRPPVVSAPGGAGAIAGLGTIGFDVTASDPDGEAISSLTADTSELPPGNDASFPVNASNTSGTFTWHPQSGDAGTYWVTFQASNALVGVDSTGITITPPNAPPALSAVADTTLNEGDSLGLLASATDPDAGQILTISATGYPASLTFASTPSVSPANAILIGVLGFTDAAGSPYSIVWLVEDDSGGTASATTILTVNNVDHAPTVTSPPVVSGVEGSPIAFSVVAADSDGDGINSLAADVLPQGAWFTSRDSILVAPTGVWGSSGGNVFVVGAYGAILHYDGGTWSGMSSGTNRALLGVWGSSGNDVFAVGQGGTILHYDGSAWSAMTSGTAAELGDVWGSSGSDVFAVGQAGTILHYDGGGWSPVTSGTSVELRDVWGSSGSDVFAVGQGGTILHYDGGAWSPMTSGTTELLEDVWGTSGSDVFAVGDFGTILHYDGGAWSPMTSGASSRLLGMWGSSGSDVFVVGDGGTILHYDGAAWSPMASGSYMYLADVWGSSGTDVYAMAAGAVILHYDGGSWRATGIAFGTFQWTPGYDQAGSYLVGFVASNALTGADNTQIDVADVNRAPVLQPLDSMIVTGGHSASQPVAASDPDGTAPSIHAYGPGFVSLAVDPPHPDSTTTGTLLASPAYGDTLGSPYWVVVWAEDSGALIDSVSLWITVVPDQAPLVSAPSAAGGEEQSMISVEVTASDPDGDPIASLTADLSALPTTNPASFNTSTDNTLGTLLWTPAVGDAGTYPVAFTASNALVSLPVLTTITVARLDISATGEFDWATAEPDTGSYTVTFTATDLDGEIGSATTQVIVLPESAPAPAPRPLAYHSPAMPQRGPIISAPEQTTVQAGQEVGITVSAYDPDRGPIISITADFDSDDPTNPPEPTNPPTFTPDLGPVVTAPPQASGSEGSLLTFQVTAADPDGDAVISLTCDFSALPLGNNATFTKGASTLGTFAWTPGFDAAGDYVVTFRATNALVGAASTAIHVAQTNRPPVADADGPYNGTVGVAIEFDGTASADPDGDGLTYAWTFGDGGSGVGSMVQHTYEAAGQFEVQLTVSDGALAATAATTADVVAALGAQAFTVGGDKVIRLRSGKPTSCLRIEPINGSFEVTDVDVGAVRLRSTGTGSVEEIAAIVGKSSIDADRDRNGIPEVEICFTKTDLRLLFSQIVGRTEVPATVEGQLLGGGGFRAEIVLDVIGSSGTLDVTVAPNPFNPSTTLTIETQKAGSIRVLLFGVDGRMLRILLQERYLPAGYHDVRIDGLDGSGRRLSSGVYLYRVETVEGLRTGRIVLLK